MRMTADTTARHPDIPVETCSRPTDVQDLQLAYSDAFTSSTGDLCSISLSVAHASQGTTYRTAAALDLFTPIRDPDVDAYPFNIQVESAAYCRKLFKRLIRKQQ